MKFFDALRSLVITNLDTEDVLIDVGENYDEFMRRFKPNLEAYFHFDDMPNPKDRSIDLLNFEMDQDAKDCFNSDEYDNSWDDFMEKKYPELIFDRDDIDYLLFEAAWLTASGYEYEDISDEDVMGDMYEDSHEYEFNFKDIDFVFTKEFDIDFT